MRLSRMPIDIGFLGISKAKSASRKQDNITGRIYLERGLSVVVLVRWVGKGPRNVLVQRQDGVRVVRPFRGLRRLPESGLGETVNG